MILLATPRDVAESRKHKLYQRGIVNPIWTCMAAKKAGLRLSYACALLEKESGGGHNVFGHDPVSPGQQVGGTVTKAKYLRYKNNRLRGLGMQGVGPTQLTWYAFQDQADTLGGCWVPRVNLYVGFNIFADYLRGGSDVWEAARRYNGADSYADHFVEIARKWSTRFGIDKHGGG